MTQFADKKGVAADVVINAVAASKGPILAGTKAEANKFHDDKSLYTGVHAKGGPSTVDTDKVTDISQTCNRGEADVRGISQQEVAQVTHGVAGIVVEEKKTAAVKAPAAKAQTAAAATVATAGAPAGTMQDLFKSFTGGAKDMEGKTFAKFAKDSKCLTKKCSATDIDLIFAKVKDKAARKITFAQFEAGVALIAAKNGSDPAEYTEKLLAAGGPVYAGTKAEANKFHDDKSLYTGVYAAGGPSNVDKDKISDISQTCDRSAADVRGTKM